MHAIEIPEAGIKRYIPADLSECSSAEYIDMCELIFKLMCGVISFDDFRVHAVYKLMNMKPVKEDLDEDKEQVKFGHIYQLSQLIDSFFEVDDQQQKTIKQYYIHNPVPYFQPLWKKYYGPSDQFMNIGFGEYTDALRLFFEFNTTGETELLYHIAAILYRPKKSFHFFKKYSNDYDGDMRVQYNAHNVQKRVKVMKYAPYGFVYGVYLLFASFQKFISSAEVPWAGRVLDLSILFNPDPNDITIDVGKDDIGMDAVMFTMAESGVFGSPKELNNTSIWMVLIRMYDVRLNDLKLKKQQEDAERNSPS